MIEIFLNSKKTSVKENQSLYDIILSLPNIQINYIAVAVNRNIIPQKKWKELFIKENDIIDIVEAIQGG